MKRNNIFQLSRAGSVQAISARERLVKLHEIYQTVSLKYHFEILRVDHNPQVIKAYRFVIEHLKRRILNETRWSVAS